jgi:TIR domain-containing protein
MADVFLSYAREDRERASVLAHAIEERGWSVWWDRHIVPGQAFDQAIEGELGRAGSVVVLWSEQSVGSEWVRNEAAAAAERRVLVPALIDPVPLPLEFRRRQTADLVDWDGDPAHPGFQALSAGIAAALGVPPLPPAVKPVRGRRSWLPAAAVVLAALAFGLYIAGPWHGGVPASAPEPSSRPAPAPDSPTARQQAGQAHPRTLTFPTWRWATTTAP